MPHASRTLADDRSLDDGVGVVGQVGLADQPGRVHVAAPERDLEVHRAALDPRLRPGGGLGHQGVVGPHSVVDQVAAAEPLALVVEALVLVDGRHAGLAHDRRQDHVAAQTGPGVGERLGHDHEHRHAAPVVEHGVAEDAVALPPGTHQVGVARLHEVGVVRTADLGVEVGVEDQALGPRPESGQHGHHVGAVGQDLLLAGSDAMAVVPGADRVGHRLLVAAGREGVAQLQTRVGQQFPVGLDHLEDCGSQRGVNSGHGGSSAVSVPNSPLTVLPFAAARQHRRAGGGLLPFGSEPFEHLGGVSTQLRGMQAMRRRGS